VRAVKKPEGDYENEQDKPKLSPQELVKKMRDEKGITFKYINEDEAADFLADHNNYLRTACYRIVYPKYQAGKDKVLKHFFMCEV
jgi:hypothetical protein